ncbi:MAG: transcription termination factor NusA [Spirochaetaceae bacterium]|jgi:N utilization substance protein A|nr:transcription termination factor NusA [Spirochaetaceae bacterium]
MSEMAEAIRQLSQEKGISEELVVRTIENTLIAAYKRKFGTSDNAVVKVAEDNSDVTIYARKKIVDGVWDPVAEIELEEALELDPECELNDELLIEIDPKDFDRISIQSGKQTAHQSIRDIQKDSLYSEYKDKVGEVIIGYYQRERNGNIYVDLGKVEGILPRKNQSPRETYHKNDRIRAIITEAKKNPSGLQVVLSRTDPEFVRRILELEVPEIYDKTVEIHNIVREPGYRTKIAVSSNRDDVDPVGACVGLKGVRIQAVIRELEGEKIDVLKFDPDPRVFIKNALAPAEVSSVVILDEVKRQALAVVADSQFSLAIGKQGLNVRLANRLVDWNIDVKTDDQYDGIDPSASAKEAANELFSGNGEEEYDEIARVSELSGMDQRIIDILMANGIEFIEDYLAVSPETLAGYEGLSKEDIDLLSSLIEDSIEIVEAEEDSGDGEEAQGQEADEQDEEYECPECGAKITIDMTTCPNCGIGLSFEYEDEE